MTIIPPEQILDHFSKDYTYQTYLAQKINRKKADDLLQEAYIKLHKRFTEKGKSFEHNNLTADRMYIYLIMSNLNTDQYRNKVEYLTLDSATINFADFGYEEEDTQIEDKEKLELTIKQVLEIIENLHWYDKELFKVYFHSGKSMRTIAKETGISLSSIFTTLKETKLYIKNNI